MAQPLNRDMARARAIYRDNNATFRDLSTDESISGKRFDQERQLEDLEINHIEATGAIEEDREVGL